MCGIAGFVDFSGRPATGLMPVLDRLSEAIGHRGPDDWGRLVIDQAVIRETSDLGETCSPRGRASGPTVGFAHARLAIIDVSRAGHQPMATADRRRWVTYNGEIYNYQTHRGRVLARGGRLRSSSDTEVVAELLAADGDGALDGLRGMFAFGWWDDESDRLLLARDRFGIKPLVFARVSPDVVLFASQPRALFATGLLSPSVAPGRAAEFLTRGSIDTASSFWDGVAAVPPGTIVEVRASSTTSKVYWSLERALLEPGPEGPAADLAPTAHEAIVDAVGAHMVSDVPVAIFLSGGLDSTAVLAAARQTAASRLQTFTVSMPGSALDESAAARAIATAFGSEHLEVAIDDIDLDASLDEFFRAMQTPSVDGFNTFLVARAARQAGVKVALSGVGGDELFGGYDSFTGVPRVGALCQVAGLNSMGSARLAAMLRRWRSPRAVKLAAILDTGPRTTAEVWWEYRRLFSSADVLALSGAEAPKPPGVAGELPAFSVIRFLETRCFLQAQLLQDTDAFTMCRALELRTPFVDHVLAETIVRAGRWPRDRGRSYKQTLFAQLPSLTQPGAVQRRKQGFFLPYDAWLREALAASAPRRLRDFSERMRQPAYAPFVAQFTDGRLHWSRLWALYVFDRLTASRHADCGSLHSDRHV
jgi:asparagine synthase (glutamine-hydrolysing)